MASYSARHSEDIVARNDGLWSSVEPDGWSGDLLVCWVESRLSRSVVEGLSVEPAV